VAAATAEGGSDFFLRFQFVFSLVSSSFVSLCDDRAKRVASKQLDRHLRYERAKASQWYGGV